MLPDSFVNAVGGMTILIALYFAAGFGRSIFQFYKYDLKENDRRKRSEDYDDLRQKVMHNHDQIIEILRMQTTLLDKLVNHSMEVKELSADYVKWSNQKISEIHAMVHTKK